jgi:hypothetical protein
MKKSADMALKHLGNKKNRYQAEWTRSIAVGSKVFIEEIKGKFGVMAKGRKTLEQSANKSAYAYILTPSGLESKARVTARFLRRKIAEYEKLQIEIEAIRREVAPDENVVCPLFAL